MTETTSGDARGVVHHVMWPEGAPTESRSTTSWWRASFTVLRMQIGELRRGLKARRIRQAISIGDPVIPAAAEARIEIMGGRPPTAGWPRPTGDASDIGADARIVTHAVV